MKKIVLIFAFLFMCLNMVFAQKQQNPSDKVKNELAVLQKADLNLSDVQVVRITTVLTASEQLYMENMKLLEGNKAVLQTRLKELKANKISNVRGAMTDQQVVKFDALKLEEKLD